jgi:ribosomal 50S subunit-associated protein YjgA (DUF615 family)
MTTMRNSQSTILVFVAITAAIEAVLADNPDADLLEIEQLFRAAASAAYWSPPPRGSRSSSA